MLKPTENTKGVLSSQLEPQCSVFTAETQTGASTASSNQPSVAVAGRSAIPAKGDASNFSLAASLVVAFFVYFAIYALTIFAWNSVFARTCSQQGTTQNKISSLKDQQNSSVDLRKLLIQNNSQTTELRKTVKLLLSEVIELSEKVEKIEKSLNQENQET